jgi:uncharacterized protein YoxC
MKLVKLENFELKVEDELLLLKPFKELYDADKTATKDKFMTFLSLLYFTYDPRSDYSYIIDEKDRLEEVCKANGVKVKEFTKKELQCIDVYKSMISTSSLLLLEDTKIAVNKIREFLRDIDLGALDDKGKPIYTINTVTSAIKQIPQLAKDLIEAERAVAKEIEEKGRARGGNNKTLFDDGIEID